MGYITIKAWDKKRKQFIPSEHFVVTPNLDKILIAFDEHDVLLSPVPEFGGYKESEDVKIEDVRFTVVLHNMTLEVDINDQAQASQG